MYHRWWGDNESHHTTAKIAERIRLVLMRTLVLMAVLLAAPYLYGILTGGRLDNLAGTTPVIWETIQWSVLWVTIFIILAVIGIAWCRPGGRGRV